MDCIAFLGAQTQDNRWLTARDRQSKIRTWSDCVTLGRFSATLALISCGPSTFITADPAGRVIRPLLERLELIGQVCFPTGSPLARGFDLPSEVAKFPEPLF